MFLSIKSIFSVVFIHQVYCMPHITSREKDETISYLQSFGYLPKTKNITAISHNQLKQALKRLQVSRIYFWIYN